MIDEHGNSQPDPAPTGGDSRPPLTGNRSDLANAEAQVHGRDPADGAEQEDLGYEAAQERFSRRHYIDVPAHGVDDPAGGQPVYEQDYLEWRHRQMERLDSDYRRWRQESGQPFSAGFLDWRKEQEQ